MDVALTPDLERLVEEKVESGQYPSRDAVVRAALEVFRAQEAAEDRLETLLEEVDGDPGVELTPELRSEIERRAAEALRTRQSA